MKTNTGLVSYCMKQLGNPYWWGTFREFGNKTIVRAKKETVP